MREYNISDRNKYYRQNNNELKPGIRCKPTATVEALDLAGLTLPSGGYKQPEDNLTDYMERVYGPDSPEDWGYINKAINDHFLPGTSAVIGPRYNWTLAEALFGLTQHIPFVASTWLTPFGHVVNIVGFITEQEEDIKDLPSLKMNAVKTIIIDDPYGDKTSGVYVTKKTGFNNKYDKTFFHLHLWRGIGIQVYNRRMKV